MPVPGSDPPQKEEFLLTLPALHIEGLIFGAPFIELEGASYITSSSGFTAKIDYSGKGWLSGKKNSVTAVLYPTGREKEILYNVAGQWTTSFEIYSGPAKGNKPSTLVETYKAADVPSTSLIVAPIEEQHPLESRRAWAKVAAAISKTDLETVSIEKGKIEQAQRNLRAKERSEGRMWRRRFFTIHTDQPDAVLTELGPVVGLAVHGDGDKTGGLWRFDEAKAEKARKDLKLSAEEQAKVAKDILGQS